MKTIYPDYNKGDGTKSIEATLSNEDRAILEDYLKFCRTTSGEERVNQKIKTYMLQFYDIINKPLDKWSLKDIQELIILINACNKAEYTKNDLKKLLKRFLKYQYKKHEDLEVMLSLIKCKSDINAFNYQRVNENTLVNDLEFEKILLKANTLKQKAILCLLFEAGLRPQELRALKWIDVKIDDDIGSITVFSTKTRKTRTIPIQSSIIHLKRWKEEYEYPNVRQDDYVFPNPRDRNKPLSDNALPMMFRRLSGKAGINKNIFPYLLRHSRITEINKRLPAHLESKFAGHSIKQSQIYTHLSSDDLRTAMLQKVFNVKEMPKTERDRLEEEIKNIRKEFDKKFVVQQEQMEQMIKNYLEKIFPIPINTLPEKERTLYI